MVMLRWPVSFRPAEKLTLNVSGYIQASTFLMSETLLFSTFSTNQTTTDIPVSFWLVEEDLDENSTDVDIRKFPPLILVFCCVPFLITHLYYSTLLGPQVKADLNLILRFAHSSDCRWVGHLSLGSRSVDNVGTQRITWWWCGGT